MDRNFQPNLKKDIEDEDDDEPNSKLKIQADLEAMYMGPTFLGEKVFSRMMSTLLVLLTFSGAMPVLYMIGVIFYSMTYFVNKVVLFKFYQKTITLNRVLPL